MFTFVIVYFNDNLYILNNKSYNYKMIATKSNANYYI